MSSEHTLGRKLREGTEQAAYASLKAAGVTPGEVDLERLFHLIDTEARSVGYSLTPTHKRALAAAPGHARKSWIARATQDAGRLAAALYLQRHRRT